VFKLLIESMVSFCKGRTIVLMMDDVVYYEGQGTKITTLDVVMQTRSRSANDTMSRESLFVVVVDSWPRERV